MASSADFSDQLLVSQFNNHRAPSYVQSAYYWGGGWGTEVRQGLRLKELHLLGRQTFKTGDDNAEGGYEASTALQKECLLTQGKEIYFDQKLERGQWNRQDNWMGWVVRSSGCFPLWELT